MSDTLLCKCISYHNSLGKLDGCHLITTTWILNENISYAKVNEIILECEKNKLVAVHNTSGNITVSGCTTDFDNFLKTDLHKFSSEHKEFHAPNSNILIPQKWQNDIVNILGLDTYPIAKPYIQFQKSELTPRINTGFTPTQLANLYNFPKDLDGTGQKIGIISLGGGYNPADIVTYLTQLGINSIPNIIDVSVDGGTNNITNNVSANTENILDIEVIVAIVPKAEIRVYFAPNSFQGFYNAVNKGISDNCSIISISWGAPESLWSKPTMALYNSLFESASKKNITILAASGDNGSNDGTSQITVDFPSSSPFIVACGGTTVTADNTFTTITNEFVWNNNPLTSATGGGISSYFDKPQYQTTPNLAITNKRGVPDISGNADPNTGYILYMDGNKIIIGGTSGVSPLWSGLLARINQSIKKNVGFIHPIIYANPSACRDILLGNNGAYSASIGWDACSGNGSPNGIEILKLFESVSVPIPVPVIPVPIIPIAKFECSSTKITLGTVINFHDKSLNNPITWSWNFGDRSPLNTMKNPSHLYKQAGIYDITLTVTNKSGSNTIIVPNNIVVTSTKKHPISHLVSTNLTASFTANKIFGKLGSVIQFTSTSNGSVNKWEWDFGDGFNNNTLSNPQHVYNTKGTYTVQLTISNGIKTDTIIKEKYITIR